MTNYIPNGTHTVTPYLILKDASKAIDFYKKAFGAEELVRLLTPDGKIMHACIQIGDSKVMISDEMPNGECGGLGPNTLKNFHAVLHVFVKDVDASFQRAVDAGAEGKMPPQNMFWGDRYTRIVDPFGQPWSLATHIEDLTPEQMQERAQEFFKQMATCAAK